MNLENLGVQEMNVTEVKNVEGGFVFVALALAAVILYNEVTKYD